MSRFIVSQLMLQKDIKKQPTRCALQYICFNDFLWQQTISHKSSTAHVFWSVLVFLDIKLLTMCVRPWRHNRKGDTTLLSFWDFYLFESEGREKQDYDFAAFFFSFQIFETFGNLEIEFTVSFGIFPNNDQFYWSYATF